MPVINFFEEDIKFKIKNKRLLRSWIEATITSEGYKLKHLNIIVCSDVYLLQINQQYLNHDTFTDIITFDNSENELEIIGDIYVSVERIRENAQTFNTIFVDELHRVLIHGTLHLLGYFDKATADKQLMTKKENEHLSKRNFTL